MPPSPQPDTLAPIASPKAYLDRVRALVEARLTTLFDGVDRETRALAPDALPVLDAAKGLTMRGGKRLRPALLFAARDCIEPDAHPDASVDLGAAIELFQTYLLIHDDWMDNDPVRRGAPSVHVALTRHYEDSHLGASAAILAGDLLSALVHDLVASVEIPSSRRGPLVRAWSRMEREVILGQCLDVTHSEDVQRIHDLKTGSYTVRGPMLLGAAIAGANEAARAAIERFAEPLGLAFQLRDDILGAFGSEADTGKPVGGDFREGKNTALVRHALDHLSAADATALRTVLGRRDATEAEVLDARALVERSGAREHAEAEVAALRARCLTALDTDALRDDGRRLLEGFATVLTERSK
jgi:geranylgeranyl diphosphate synthase, type I